MHEVLLRIGVIVLNVQRPRVLRLAPHPSHSPLRPPHVGGVVLRVLRPRVVLGAAARAHARVAVVRRAPAQVAGARHVDRADHDVVLRGDRGERMIGEWVSRWVRVEEGSAGKWVKKRRRLEGGEFTKNLWECWFTS